MRRLRLRKGAVWLGLHGMNDVGKLDRVLNEENGNVVADEIPVALFRIQLDGEPAHIAREIERTFAPSNG